MSQNVVQKATGASPSGLTDSLIFDDGTTVGINSAPTASAQLFVNGLMMADSGFAVSGTVADAGFMRLVSNSTGMQARMANNAANVGMITTDGADNLLVGFSNAQAVIFKPQNTERVRVDATGNVGIGTTGPSYLLDVAGSGSGTLDISRLQNTVAAANGSAAEMVFAANRTTGGLTNVAAVSGLITDISNSAYKGALVLSTASNAAPAERMRIDSTGRVGIGTNAPGQQLSVVGTIETTSGGYKFPDATTQTTAAIPVVGGASAALGKRACWVQYAGGTNGSMDTVGTSSPVLTGGSGVMDNDGFWAHPTAAIVGSQVRLSFTNKFTRVNLLPRMVVRLRTPAVITNFRFLISLNESLAGVNTDTPSTTTQRGIYVRYSTTASDGGWVCQTVDGSGRSVSSTIAAIAATTLYLITITVNSTSSVTIDINGASTTVSSNIVTGVDLGAEVLAGDTGSSTVVQFDLQSVYLESR